MVSDFRQKNSEHYFSGLIRLRRPRQEVQKKATTISGRPVEEIGPLRFSQALV